MAISFDMARTSVKATYSLDLETVRVLDEVSRRWGVSKSEALRRAILASANLPADGTNDRLAALDRAQRAAGLTLDSANAWVREIRAERRATKRPRG